MIYPYSHTMECCAAIKGNKLLIQATKWVNIKNIVLTCVCVRVRTV